MHLFHPYTLPAPYTYRTMIPTFIPPPHMQPHNASSQLPHTNTHYPLLSNPLPQPFNPVTNGPWRGPQDTSQQYHHYYGPSPWQMWSNNHWNYQHFYTSPLPLPVPVPTLAPVAPSPAKPPSFQTQSGTWPEGFTLRGDLRWGRLERVYGPRRELPEFVREDLRRVYGTYPRTDLSITFQGGEYLVRGNPHAGEQEYRVERRVIRQAESPDGDSVSEVVEKKKRRWTKGRRS